MTEPTSYIILLLENDGSWTSLGYVNARNATDAIRKLATATNTPHTYVAVPARSWKPFTVTAETQVILKLEQPT